MINELHDRSGQVNGVEDEKDVLDNLENGAIDDQTSRKEPEIEKVFNSNPYLLAIAPLQFPFSTVLIFFTKRCLPKTTC